HLPLTSCPPAKRTGSVDDTARLGTSGGHAGEAPEAPALAGGEADDGEADDGEAAGATPTPESTPARPPSDPAGAAAEVETLDAGTPNADASAVVRAPTARPAGRPEDDRDRIGPDDAVLLVVEDDPYFARVLVDIAREKGFKVVVTDHAEGALAAVRRFKPAAITLDVKLPGMHGLALLDRLKN